ncbi:hypothetical protein HNQ81_003155 [Desulfoprunum benzoelyticum]|uniref:Uncharacterized protein n=1 Tax=Desulfoprunum benzoelyticum TaxID=1506996 RepID=A0A840V8Y1_9BACT|nr:hypothetical protein [Desulfoprunum benzoelyticum]
MFIPLSTVEIHLDFQESKSEMVQTDRSMAFTLTAERS